MRLRRTVVSVLAVLAALPLARPMAAVSAGTWTAVASMREPRTAHTVSLLPDGRVLVAGGENFETGNTEILRSAEIFDPASGAWSLTTDMLQPRRGAASVTLNDGRVLVAGGDDFGSLAQAEIYDPVSETWTAADDMHISRSGAYGPPPLVLLDDGRVLAAGGDSRIGRTAAAEIFDPSTGTWTPTGAMQDNRDGHTATRLNDGRVAVAGGEGGCPPFPCGALQTVEIWDPSSGTFSTAPFMRLPRTAHSAALLPDGSLLVAGGFWCASGTLQLVQCDFHQTAEVFDPVARSWRPAVPMIANRGVHSVTTLADGDVLVAGGRSDGRAEIHQAATGLWLETGRMDRPRFSHRAVRLDDGRVFVPGGSDGFLNPRTANAVATAEVFAR